MKLFCRIYLVLAIFFGVVGLVQCVRWSYSGYLAIEVFLLNFFPGMIFFMAYLGNRKRNKIIVHFIAIVFCLLSLATWGFITLGVEMIVTETTEVTDITKYEEVLDDYWNINKELVSHFPRPIPSDAKDVRFSFLPAFLQGGAHIQLRYGGNPDAVLELYDKFSEMKTKSFVGGDMSAHINMEDGMPTTLFYTNGSDNLEFPDDYEIMIFDDVLTEDERSAGYDWNHGQSHGVAISKKRNEVIYWAESW